MPIVLHQFVFDEFDIALFGGNIVAGHEQLR